MVAIVEYSIFLLVPHVMNMMDKTKLYMHLSGYLDDALIHTKWLSSKKLMVEEVKKNVNQLHALFNCAIFKIVCCVFQ